MSAPRLYLNHDADYDWLIAVEFGRIDEGQGAGAWDGVSDRFGVLHMATDDRSGSRCTASRISRHLRYYTEIASELRWGWCWFGKAAASIGETAEARAAFGRAIALEQAGGEETDGPELLAVLEGALAGAEETACDPAVVVRDAVTGCGALVERGPSFLESYLVRAFCTSAERSAEVVATGPVAVPIPGWDPQPGATDIVVTLPNREGRVLAEAKVDDIHQLVWDLFKMASASEIDGVRPVCLLGAARAIWSPGLPSARWAGSQACAELFDPENSGRVWEAADMLGRWTSAWTALLREGRARPTRVPARVRVTFLGSSPVRSFPGYEARCIEIRVTGDEWLAPEDLPPAE